MAVSAACTHASTSNHCNGCCFSLDCSSQSRKSMSTWHLYWSHVLLLLYTMKQPVCPCPVWDRWVAIQQPGKTHAS
jgi:hypothetical protein